MYKSINQFQNIVLSLTSSLQCSRDCQKSDWPHHRSECGRSDITVQPDACPVSKSDHSSTGTNAFQKAEPCRECEGTGLMDIQVSPSVPLSRLEGVTPGIIVRQKNCTVCGGDGIMRSESNSTSTEIPRWTMCHICQAYGGEPCTCGRG